MPGSRRLERTLRRLFVADQRDRVGRSTRGALAVDDLTACSLAMAIPLNGLPLSSKAKFVLAMILHHSGNSAQLKRAQAWAAHAVRTGYPKSRWLHAAIFDRRLILQGKPQRYGTQFRRDPQSGALSLVALDGLCSDAERIRLGLAPVGDYKASPCHLDESGNEIFQTER